MLENWLTRTLFLGVFFIGFLTICLLLHLCVAFCAHWSSQRFFHLIWHIKNINPKQKQKWFRFRYDCIWRIMLYFRSCCIIIKEWISNLIIRPCASSAGRGSTSPSSTRSIPPMRKSFSVMILTPFDTSWQQRRIDWPCIFTSSILRTFGDTSNNTSGPPTSEVLSKLMHRFQCEGCQNRRRSCSWDRTWRVGIHYPQ